MVKFSQALYSKEGESRFIEVKRILHQNNYDDFVNHLFCPDENCDAKLIYVRTREGGYLKKPQGFEHKEECDYADDSIRVVPETVYIEINGNISDDGISRRNKNMGKKLRDFLNPPEEKKVAKSDKKKTTRSKKDSDDPNSKDVKTGVRIKYDPNSIVSKEELDQNGTKTREPAFISVLLHQISERDSNKNLSTVGLIKNVVLNKEQSSASIQVVFENVKATIYLPQAFFSNSIRGLSKEQLFEYVEMLGKYIRTNPDSLYINTMCQTHKIDIENLALYVYDPDFPSFILASNTNREFRSLSVLASMISTNAI
jgi:hypothetical protein